MTNDTRTDVLICGAGASGLTLAIELARRGVSFRLVEQKETPFHGSRGKGLQPRTLEVFEDLGILERIVAAGGSYPRQRSYRDDGGYAESALMEHADPTPAEPYPAAVMLPQYLTEQLMRERLAELGHRPAFGHTLIEFEEDADGVSARIAGPQGERTIRARYLVGTDGGRSTVRRMAGIDFPGKTLGARGLVADVVLTGLDRNAWHRFRESDPQRQVAICPLAGTGLFQIQAPVPLEGDVDLSVEGLMAMVAERTGRDDIRIDSVSWASAFQMHARLADRYRVGRVFLAGDAAHTHPPTGGQGLNTSVQDAYNLGWKLAAAIGGAPDALLDSYEQERRPIAADMLGLSTQLLDSLQRGDLRRGREVRQLDLGYPRSPLAWERPGRAFGLSAGDRAPDAPVHGAAGMPTRLFQLFKGTHWTLLGYEVERDAVPPRAGLHIHAFGVRGDLIDDGGHFRDAYTPSPGSWILVRPDGYLGAIVSTSHLDALEEYLRQVGFVEEGVPA